MTFYIGSLQYEKLIRVPDFKANGGLLVVVSVTVGVLHTVSFSKFILKIICTYIFRFYPTGTPVSSTIKGPSKIEKFPHGNDQIRQRPMTSWLPLLRHKWRTNRSSMLHNNGDMEKDFSQNFGALLRIWVYRDAA